ncbi:uncharacterized protein UTRI_01472 [Ustilago trichophora]|uniref:Uncharacterized protein n=1 Tax=Ustilago trichophora TaxID=86804 RepID=A0A5C3DWD3_9BASI|nr:uncharacterized protein UTRI_01472 [Ustilago trichophora]
MPAKTRKASKAAAVASSDHLHPSSAAVKPAKTTTTTTNNNSATSASSSSSTATLNGSTTATHVPLKTTSSSVNSRTRTRHPHEVDNGWTWNPIKLIERKLFRAYWNVEATFVLSMLEAWEVFLVIVVFITLTLLLWYSLIHYFPRHAQQVATRALYYVYGNSPPPQLAAAVTNNATTSPVTTSASTAAAAAAGVGEGVLEKLIETSNQLWASLDAEKAAKETNPEVVDRLISNLNKVKQMIATSTGGKSEL